MKEIGDKYVKEEFRQHKEASPEFVEQFLQEWKRYARTLEKQANVDTDADDHPSCIWTTHDERRMGRIVAGTKTTACSSTSREQKYNKIVCKGPYVTPRVLFWVSLHKERCIFCLCACSHYLRVDTVFFCERQDWIFIFHKEYWHDGFRMSSSEGIQQDTSWGKKLKNYHRKIYIV